MCLESIPVSGVAVCIEGGMAGVVRTFLWCMRLATKTGGAGDGMSRSTPFAVLVLVISSRQVGQHLFSRGTCTKNKSRQGAQPLCPQFNVSIGGMSLRKQMGQGV